MVKAYISCPVSVSESHLQDIAIYVNKCHWEHRYWKRGAGVYNEGEFIDHCDAFILVLPDNKFQYKVDDLPSGCKRELKRAINEDRKIFIAYEGMAGVHIYTTTIGQMISGRAGSTGEFEKLGQDEAKDKPLTLSGSLANSTTGYTAQLTNYSYLQGCQNDQFNMGSADTINYTKPINFYPNPFDSMDTLIPYQIKSKAIPDYGKNLNTSKESKAFLEELGKEYESALLWGKPKVDRRAALFAHK